MELTRTPDVDLPPFQYVPTGFDPSDPTALQERIDTLHDRPLESAADLRQFVVDWGEIESSVWGEWARRFTATNRDTANEDYKQRYVSYSQEAMAAWNRGDDRLNQRYLACPHRGSLGQEFALFDRIRVNDRNIFRDENVQLEADVKVLEARHGEIQGGITVELRGETLTREQCSARLLETDRALREEAFRALGERNLPERDRIDELFDELVALRTRIARNAGFPDYIDYAFAKMHRFDYTPADCERFHRAVEKIVVPALAELAESRRKLLGVDSLRPYDARVGLFGSDPVQLFDHQDGYVALTQKILGGVDKKFSDKFDILVRNGLLDLMSRPNKAPGGYNCPVEDMGLPFIFFNAVGRRGDIRVLLHEAGHAFHTMATRGHPIVAYRSPGAEFCEVASMAMELFGIERIDQALSGEELRAFVYDQFEGCLSVFPHVLRLDAFQMWVYRNPEHTRAERTQQWLELGRRFSPHYDWSGLEAYHEASWQSIPHPFSHPLYSVEYAIAEIGALQMWRRELADHGAAIRDYEDALALGGSQTLPKLFRAAGIRFAMDEAILAELVPHVMTRLREILPAA